MYSAHLQERQSQNPRAEWPTHNQKNSKPCLNCTTTTITPSQSEKIKNKPPTHLKIQSSLLKSPEHTPNLENLPHKKQKSSSLTPSLIIYRAGKRKRPKNSIPTRSPKFQQEKNEKSTNHRKIQTTTAVQCTFEVANCALKTPNPA